VKLLNNKEGKHRQKQIERKEKQEVRNTKTDVILVKKLFFHDTLIFSRRKINKEVVRVTRFFVFLPF
jgi:hypothetical protein